MVFRLECGATWLNLLATRGRHFSAHAEERIPTLAKLGEWLGAVELTPVRSPNLKDLSEVYALRETLRPLALAVTDGAPPPAGPTAALAAFCGAGQPTLLRAGDRLYRDPPADTGAALTRIAVQAAAHLTGPERANLASCPERDCRGVFVNADGRHRWCPSPACASRGRVRALRERRRVT